MSVSSFVSPLNLELKSAYLPSNVLAEVPDLDAETLADTLEGITDMREMLAELIRSALGALASQAPRTRLNDMKARLSVSRRGPGAKRNWSAVMVRRDIQK